jgi:uncharacterized OsmC-like protein
MNASELRAVQAPLKERYRQDPVEAVVVLRAEADLSTTEVSCTVDTGRALVEAGLHRSTGGDGALACSGDMLLQALVACAGVTLRSIATNRSIEVSGTIRAEGELDFRGTLGVDRSARVGFRDIRLAFDLESSSPPEELDQLIEATERYCVVYQTLVSPPVLQIQRTSSGGGPGSGQRHYPPQ